MRTKDSAIEYSRKYLAMVKELNIKIEKAFLFGSYSNNQQRQHSDIDLAIISKDFSDDPLENWKKVGLANIKYNLVEPHLYTWKDFKGRNSFLIEEVLKKGLEIKLS
jgi:uncharacterized protein